MFGENLMDVFDDFDRTFFRGFNRPEHVLYGKNAAHMMKTDVKETEGKALRWTLNCPASRRKKSSWN